MATPLEGLDEIKTALVYSLQLIFQQHVDNFVRETTIAVLL